MVIRYRLAALILLMSAITCQGQFGMFEHADCPTCWAECGIGPPFYGHITLYHDLVWNESMGDLVSAVHFRADRWFPEEQYPPEYGLDLDWVTDYAGSLEEGMTLHFDPPVDPDDSFGILHCAHVSLMLFTWSHDFQDMEISFQECSFQDETGQWHDMDSPAVLHINGECDESWECFCYNILCSCPVIHGKDFEPEDEERVPGSFTLDFLVSARSFNPLCEFAYDGHVLLEGELYTEIEGFGFSSQSIPMDLDGYVNGDPVTVTVILNTYEGHKEYTLNYIYDDTVATQSISLGELKACYE